MLVFDASVLFNLGHRDHLVWLVQRLAVECRLCVPKQVLLEVASEVIFDYTVFCQQYFDIYTVDYGDVPVDTLDMLNKTLDLGEIEVIIAATTLGASAVIDERRARAVAQKQGVNVIGTIGLLDYALEQAWCTDQVALDTVHALIANRFSIPKAKAVRSYREYRSLF